MPIKRYENFAGVDFSNDATRIAPNRSPDSLNIMPDSGGNPEKRVGWRVMHQFDGKINGIFHLDGKMVIHSGDKMHLMESESAEPQLLMEGINNAKSFGIVFAEKLWILTGREYLCYPHEGKMVHVRDIATAPQVLTLADRSLKNGIVYQPFNLLTSKRKIGVKIPDGTSVGSLSVRQLVKRAWSEDYKYPFAQITATDAVTGENVKSKTTNVDDLYDNYIGVDITLNGTYQTKGVGDDFILEYEIEDTIYGNEEEFSPNAAEKIRKNAEKIQKNREMIEHCTFAAIYENRLFVSGNPDYPNTDFYCELNDPTYFADVNYTNIGEAEETAKESEIEEREKNYIGTGGTKIMGYSYVGKYLAIHKDGAENGASIYLRSSTMTEDGMIFPITEGIVGESILSHRAAIPFIDDPVFLTESGIYAVASADITIERSLQSRSTRVNGRLTLEKELKDAEMCVCNGYLMIFVNGNVYVADSRQKSYARNISNAFEYEWYFWDSVPAYVVKSFNDTVYFGTEEGKLCRFNNDMRDSRGGYKMSAYNDDGAPIHARWSTKMDDMGDFSVRKILRRRGSGVYAKSYGAGDIRLSVRTERDFGRENTVKRIGIFNFSDMSELGNKYFEHFTFNTLPFSFVPFSRKVKDYRMMQVIAENNEPNQCMGVIAIECNFDVSGYAK